MASVWMSSRVVSVWVYFDIYYVFVRDRVRWIECESERGTDYKEWLRIGENASVLFVTNIDNERTNEQAKKKEREWKGQNERNIEKISKNFEIIYPYIY